MRYISLNFNIHKPFILNKFHFFDIGTGKEYFDYETQKNIIMKADEEFYAPTLEMFLSLIKHLKGRFKFSVTISG